MAFPVHTAGRAIFIKRGRGDAGEATGPQPHEFLKLEDPKPCIAPLSPASQPSTAPPSPLLDALALDSPCWGPALPGQAPSSFVLPTIELDPVDDLFEEERSRNEVEMGGITRTVSRGAPPSVEQLEDGRLVVKILCDATCGEGMDVDEEEDDFAWTATRGAPSVEVREDGLSAVKALRRARSLSG